GTAAGALQPAAAARAVGRGGRWHAPRHPAADGRGAVLAGGPVVLRLLVPTRRVAARHRTPAAADRVTAHPPWRKQGIALRQERAGAILRDGLPIGPRLSPSAAYDGAGPIADTRP